MSWQRSPDCASLESLQHSLPHILERCLHRSSLVQDSHQSVKSGLCQHMAERDPTAPSLLIAAPEPSALLVLDGEFLTSSHREFSGIVSSRSGSRLAVCIQLDDSFRDPAAFSSLIGTPDPHPGGIVLPGTGSFAHGKRFASFNSNWVRKLGLIVLRHPACAFGVCLQSAHKALLQT